MTDSSPYDYDQAEQAAEFIRSKFDALPKVAVLAGTGLGDATASARIDGRIDYHRIPHFPISTAPTHAGRFMVGALADHPVIVLQGRFHLYEGYPSRAVAFPLRVLQMLNVKTLILTNASGGLNPVFAPGDIMIIDDHINLTGANPLIGANEERWGERYPDMTSAYDGRLKELAQNAAQQLDVGARAGVYVGLRGPSLETPAEMRFLRSIGADAVGFSTVVETIAAVHAGMQVLGLSVITNMCLPDALMPASVPEIIALAQETSPRLEALISEVLTRMGS